MNFKTEQLQTNHYPLLEVFCAKADRLGYVNNASFKALKIDELREGHLAYWIILQNEAIVALAGCQALPQVENSCFRVLFRSCVLPEFKFRSSLARSPVVASVLWRHILPRQIEWAKNFGGDKLIISENREQDGVKPAMRMENANRLMQRISKSGVVSLWKENIELYETPQDLYLLDIEKFAEELRALTD